MSKQTCEIADEAIGATGFVRDAAVFELELGASASVARCVSLGCGDDAAFTDTFSRDLEICAAALTVINPGTPDDGYNALNAIIHEAAGAIRAGEDNAPVSQAAQRKPLAERAAELQLCTRGADP